VQFHRAPPSFQTVLRSQHGLRDLSDLNGCRWKVWRSGRRKVSPCGKPSSGGGGATGGAPTSAHETANAGAIVESRLSVRRRARHRPSRIAMILTMALSSHRAKIGCRGPDIPSDRVQGPIRRIRIGLFYHKARRPPASGSVPSVLAARAGRLHWRHPHACDTAGIARVCGWRRPSWSRSPHVGRASRPSVD
jgi:hypothetical protein